MKRISFLIFVALLSLIALAYEAKINGIYYNFSESEAEVTSSNNNTTEYTGVVVIPESVTYHNKTYSVTSIGINAFAKSSNLISVTIPESVTKIGGSAFLGCSSLTSITIPESVTSIGHWAFQGCRSLTSLNIPGSVTIIDQGVFSSCTSLKSVNIPECVTSIGPAAFNDCGSLASVTIPNGVTSIDNGAFCGCRSLKSITIPEGITRIGFVTFKGCRSLTTIIIPNGVTRIEGEAFMDCSGLVSVTIPNSVTNIEDCAFYGCRSLTDVYCYAPEPPSVSTTDFEGSWDGYPFEQSYIEEHTTLHVPASSLEKYKTALRWSEFANIVALPEPVIFTKDQMATIILPTAPDASKGKYYRLDRVEDGQIIFEQEKQPRARVPYIIVPSEDFSIDISSLDLESLQADTVTVGGVSFIGSYVRKELPALTGGDGGGSLYYDIIDTTPDCGFLSTAETGKEAFRIGALRAYLTVNWDDPYNHHGSKGPKDKLDIVLKDDGTGSLTPTPSPGRGEIYDLSGRKWSMINGQCSMPKGIYIQNNRKLVK